MSPTTKSKPRRQAHRLDEKRKTESPLRIALVTDLHACDDDPKATVGATSWLRLSTPRRPAEHPIAALEELIRTENLSAHYLVCAGDIADRANPKALLYVWNELQALRTALGARRLIATPGNHDVDSRNIYNDYDAKGYLQSLVPPYPLDNEVLNDRFWSRHYVILDEPECRFLVLNSSAYHGQSGKADPQGKPLHPPEYEHGRISTKTLDALKREVESLSTSKPINLLVCHHHPHRHDDLEPADFSIMEEGTRLIDYLGASLAGRWLILHGHKHQPRLSYGGGGSRAPIVFGAGSLCAYLSHYHLGHARNQFYLLELPWQDFEALGLDLAGTFRAWDWSPGVGWQVASLGSGLPARGGFGYSVQLGILAQEIDSLVGSRRLIRWSDLVSGRPALHYLLPRDLNQLVELVRVRHIEVTRGHDGAILELSRQP